ncbi:MAG: dihydropyrimidinase [Candidatus Bathyarchaeia archaeon]|jgi:dihydropyrimidinase
MLDLIIRNGKIVTGSDTFEGEIGIKDGKVVEVSKSSKESASRVINAQGKLVFPGFIDGHTHMEMPFMGTETIDDFYHGTVAAACGGVTTIVDFATPSKGDTLLDAYKTWRMKADPKVTIDYGLHMIFRDFNPTNLSQVGALTAEGVVSLKVFMAYKGAFSMNDGSIFRVMEEAVKNGSLVGLHAENGEVIDCLVARYLSEGKIDPEYHAKSRPSLAEAEAVQRGIRLAEMAHSPLYIVHVSTGLAVNEIKEAQTRGVPIYSETCPHYLTFTDEALRRPDGNRYIMSPPLRSEEDSAKLWQGLANGSIQTVGSDHAVFTLEQKNQHGFDKVPNGVPGTEQILPILYSQGIGKNIFSLNRLVQVGSSNAAKMYGLYPRKGTIAVGSDADIIIFDPQKKVRLSADNLHSNIDYSIYEDVTVTGYPVMTISRGDVIAENGQFSGKKGRGQFVKGVPFVSGRPDL